MPIGIVADANVIISALIGGASREILFDYRYEFYTTEFTIQEVLKYASVIAEKADVSEEFVKETLELLPLKVVKRKDYEDTLKKADALIGKIDKKDVEILALVLKMDVHLWSEDGDFDGLKIKRLRTKDFF